VEVGGGSEPESTRETGPPSTSPRVSGGGKTRHQARRTCVACREEGTKDDLVRLVRGPSGVEVDRSGRAPGRGAYLHRRAECVKLARKRGALARALSSPVPDSVWSDLTG
jgi:predicted RNA-binding protein YlxR (DUF448 family)